MGSSIDLAIAIVNIIFLGFALHTLYKNRDDGRWFWLVRHASKGEEELGVFPSGMIDENGIIWGLEEPPPAQ
jgi:hypothetical protein